MDSRYHGAPGWSNPPGQYDPSFNSQLPPSSRGATGGPPHPNGYNGPPSYAGSQPQYAPQGAGFPQQAHSRQTAFIPGQYGQSANQGPPSTHSSQGFQVISGPTSSSGAAHPSGYQDYGQQAQAFNGPPSQGYHGPPSQGYGPPSQGYPGQQPGPMPSAASLLNPWSMLTSVTQMGQNVQASQQYVQSKVSWFTGGFFGQLFFVDPDYVRRKLILLLAPFLSKYDYLRQAENMAAGMTTMRPPRDDLYAPDLYIPVLAVFTYVILSAGNKFAKQEFTPVVVYNMFQWATIAWGVNFAVMWFLIKLIGLHAPPPALEIAAYSGYSFVGYCVSIVFGWLLGPAVGWYSAWFYTSASAAIFLIRTFKQLIRIDAAQRGRNVMYLLLIMGGSQFFLAWIMGATVHSPHITAFARPAADAAAAS